MLKRGLILGAFGMFLTACYVYDPVESPPPPGTRVRAALTVEGAVRAGEVTGDPSRTVEGRLLEGGDAAMRLAVVTDRPTAELDGGRTFWNELSISWEQVEQVSVRRFSWWRTVALGVALGAGIGVTVDQISSGGGNGDPTDGGRNPEVIIRIVPSGR